MNKLLDNSLHELTKHGTTEYPIGVYGDSYQRMGDYFYYYHQHEELEIIYTLKGSIDILVNDKSYHLNENESIIVNSSTLHKIDHNNYPKSDVVTIVFSKKLVEFNPYSDIQSTIIDRVFNSNYEAIILTDSVPNGLINDITKINWYNLENKTYKLETVIKMLELINYIYKHKDEISIIESKSINDERIKKAISYIQAHYSEQIKLSDIAEICYLSEGECSRMFKRYVGVSPIDYLIKYRINIAASLLTKTDMPITYIATSCGFSSSNYFTIAFKKELNITPSELRHSKKEL